MRVCSYLPFVRKVPRVQRREVIATQCSSTRYLVGLQVHPQFPNHLLEKPLRLSVGYDAIGTVQHNSSHVSLGGYTESVDWHQQYTS